MSGAQIPPELGDYGLLASLIFYAARVSGPAAVVALSAAFCHLFIAGRRRIALLPVYAACIVPYFGAHKGGLGEWSEQTVSLARAGMLLAIAASLLLDRFLFPLAGSVLRPTGKFATAMHLVHVQRAVHRANFMLRVYYPTMPTKKAEKHPYFLFGAGVAEGMANYAGIPTALLAWLRFTQPWCYDADPVDAKVAVESGPDSGMPVPNGRLPVAILSHGLASCADLYGGLIREMCSKGWVVLAPDHADETAACTEFESGRKMGYRPLTKEQKSDRNLEWRRRHEQLRSRLPEVSTCLDIACELANKNGIPSPSPADKKGKSIGSKSSAMPDNLRVDDDGGDESFASEAMSLDNDFDAESEAPDMQLLRLMLGGKVAADDGTIGTSGSVGVRVLLIGHSFGGATVIAASENEPRVLGVLGLDPWIFPLSPSLLSRGIKSVPICALACDDWVRWKENHVGVRMLIDEKYRAGYVKGQVHGGTLSVKQANGICKDGTVDPAFAVEEAARVHPLSQYLSLKDTRHLSFTDFTTLMETISAYRNSVSGKQPGATQTALIRSILTSYPPWLASARIRAGMPPYDPPARVKAALYPTSA